MRIDIYSFYNGTLVRQLSGDLDGSWGSGALSSVARLGSAREMQRLPIFGPAPEVEA